MSQTGNSPSDDKSQVPYIPTLRVAAIGGEVGCLTLLIVLVGVFGGLWLDQLFDTKPLFTILFVLGSAPLSLVLTFWLVMRTMKNINPTPDSKGQETFEEDETGE